MDRVLTDGGPLLAPGIAISTALVTLDISVNATHPTRGCLSTCSVCMSECGVCMCIALSYDSYKKYTKFCYEK